MHVGRVNLSEPNENVQVMKVANIVIHPEFRPNNGSNDIAIVQLSSDFNYTDSVGPACLWSEDDDLHRIVGTTGTVIGFGLNEEYKDSETLQEASLTVVDMFKCVLNDRHTFGNFLTEKMFCARGMNNVSACNGDSGGGLFFNIDGTWYFRGIVSVIPSKRVDARDVCDYTKYTVFTDVSKFREWIFRYTKTEKWLKELTPCPDSVIDENTMCNAASRHDHGFFMLVTENDTRRVSLSDGRDVKTLENLSVNFILAQPDCAEGRLYVLTFEVGHIYSMNYDGTDKKIFIEYGSSMVHSLAVDWVSRRLYWGNIIRRTIEVARLDYPDARTVLFANASAWRIAVDPHQGKLFWLNDESIEWSNLDGSDHQVLIENNRLSVLCIWMSTGELCYSDSLTKMIKCIETRTKRVRTVARVTFITVFPIFATNENFYWLDYNSDWKVSDTELLV